MLFQPLNCCAVLPLVTVLDLHGAHRFLISDRDAKYGLEVPIAVREGHLKRLLSEYVRYYHEDRTHLGLRKGTPNGRSRSITSERIDSHERLGGFHHRYDWAA